MVFALISDGDEASSCSRGQPQSAAIAAGSYSFGNVDARVLACHIYGHASRRRVDHAFLNARCRRARVDEHDGTLAVAIVVAEEAVSRLRVRYRPRQALRPRFCSIGQLNALRAHVDPLRARSEAVLRLEARADAYPLHEVLARAPNAP